MARLVSTTSTYGAPARAATLKALQERQEALARQQAKAMADQTPIADPWQGVAKLAQQFATGQQMKRAEAEESAGRQQVAEIMGRYAQGGTATPEDLTALGGLDPDTALRLSSDMVTQRRQQAALQEARAYEAGKLTESRTYEEKQAAAAAAAAINNENRINQRELDEDTAKEQRARDAARTEVREPTPEERQRYGLPADKPFTMKRKGVDGAWEPEAIGGGGVTNIIAPEDKAKAKWGENRATNLGTLLNDTATAGLNAKQGAANLDQLEKMIDVIPTGSSAMAKDYLKNNWGISLEGADKLQMFNSIIARLTPAQRPPGSGTMSDRDIDLFKQSLPSMLNSPEGNRQIITFLRGLNDYNAQMGQIAQRAQLLDDPKAAQEYFYAEAAKLANPLAGLPETPPATATGAGAATPPAAGNGAAASGSVTIPAQPPTGAENLSDEELDALIKAQGG